MWKPCRDNRQPGRASRIRGVCFGLYFCLALTFACAQVRTDTPLPTANLPAQRIGANDLLAVSVYDSPELTRTVRVGADGMMRLPMLKRRIQAEGLMPSELEAAIASALTAEQLIVDPFVTVTIAEYNSRPISVAGAVKQPLTFQAAGPVTLLEAITRAGGLSPEAGPEILVSREKTGADGSVSSLVQRIPVKGLIDSADATLNVTLIGGEEVRVPEVGHVYVIGNVKKPGAFPVQDAESTVLKMLALSEGLMPYAAKDAFIYRQEANGSKNEISIPLAKIMQRKAPDTALLANDILYVPDNKGRRMTLGALEKILLFGTGATTALIYAGVR
ncbi:MAG TPA: polysaccharide biosynthesis/export family protein [Bryobacteraceae bacterium]|nr:polysaccharide biosynthesis/export family protein [Bryobacteraceae bacterium]